MMLCPCRRKAQGPFSFNRFKFRNIVVGSTGLSTVEDTEFTPLPVLAYEGERFLFKVCMEEQKFIKLEYYIKY
jgi:hypothetical protein